MIISITILTDLPDRYRLHRLQSKPVSYDVDKRNSLPAFFIIPFKTYPQSPTVLLVRIKRVSLIVLPADYLNELRDEARYAALEYSRVAAYHVLVVYFGLIILVYNYNKRKWR